MQLHRQHGGQALAGVIAAGFDLGFFENPLRVHVLIEGAGQRAAQAGQMRAAVALRDVVGETEHVFLIGIVPLHRQFDLNVVAGGVQVKHAVVERGFVAVEMLDERLDPALVFEHIFLAGALVPQPDADPGIEKRQFAQALGQHVVMKIDVGEYGGAGLEADFGAGLLGLADGLQRRLRVAEPIVLLVELAVAVDGQLQGLGQRVHHRNADPVQAAGHFVGTVVELTAGVQHGHDDLGGGTALGMFVRRDTATVVRHRHRLIGVNRHADLGAVTGQRLVDGVVHHFKNHVVQAGAIIGVADVHAGPLAYRV